MGKIQLKKITVNADRVDYQFDVSEDIRHFFQKDLNFFVQYDREIENIPVSILAIPFLGNVMQIAWLTASDVYIESVDAVFCNSLSRLKEAYQLMYPNVTFGGRLHAGSKIYNHFFSNSCKCAQMYTGGMDAVTTFIRHEHEHPLLILEYGFYNGSLCSNNMYSGDEKSERNFQADCLAAADFAKQHNVNTAFIRANYGTFIKSAEIDKVYADKMNDNFWHGLHHAMAILGAAAPIAFSEGIERLYIASSFSIGNTYPCASDPSTDNEFRFGDTSVIHDGYELADHDKAKLLVNYQKESSYQLPLRVCSWNDRNCCACEKCLRRMLQIAAEGGDPRLFGFNYEDSLLATLQRFLHNNVQFLTEKNVNKWQRIIERMQQNYDNMLEKPVYDFLCNYDFAAEKKRGLIRYYYQNFFEILGRKIRHLFSGD